MMAMATVYEELWSRKAREPGIRGVVADLIHVQKDYEIAIETALGGSIQNIVTDNEQTAKRMISILEAEPLWTCNLPPSVKHQREEADFTQREALKEPGVIGTADTLVKADVEYQ